MPIELTEQQQRVLDAFGNAPVSVIDPRTNVAYVLISVSEYEALCELMEDERKQRAIRAVGLRNAAGRMDEAP